MLTGAAQKLTPPPLVMPQFDRFDLEKVLGRGAQGTVYLATDKRLHRRVALKTLNAGADSEACDRQLSEARMVSGLQHPNIVTLFDASQENNGTYLVYEFVEGSTLAKIIRERGMLLLPLMIKTRAIGLIYADCHQDEVSFDEADLRLLRTLRSQAVMAIRQQESG